MTESEILNVSHPKSGDILNVCVQKLSTQSEPAHNNVLITSTFQFHRDIPCSKLKCPLIESECNDPLPTFKSTRLHGTRSWSAAYTPEWQFRLGLAVRRPWDRKSRWLSASQYDCDNTDANLFFLSPCWDVHEVGRCCVSYLRETFA